MFIAAHPLAGGAGVLGGKHPGRRAAAQAFDPKWSHR